MSLSLITVPDMETLVERGNQNTYPAVQTDTQDILIFQTPVEIPAFVKIIFRRFSRVPRLNLLGRGVYSLSKGVKTDVFVMR